MKKRHKAQSGIITAILLIVVVIVSAVIVFNVVYGIIKKNTSGADNTDMLTSSLEIKQTKLYVTGGAQVTIYRPAGEGTITSLKFIFESKDGEKKIITRVENMTELAQKNFVFTNSEIGYNNSDIKAIYVAPVYGDKVGREVTESSTSYNKDNNGNRVYDVKADSGLISWWKFDGNMKDSVGGNDGSCTSCPTSGNDNKGNLNMAYSFNAVDNYIDIGDKLDLGTNDFSLGAWVKFNNSGDNWEQEIIQKQNYSTLWHGYIINVVGSFYPTPPGPPHPDRYKAGFVLSMGNCSKGECFSLITTKTLNDNIWHNIFGTVDRDGLMKLYLDGILQNQVDISSKASLTPDNNLNLQIGGLSGWTGRYFNGSIDNVMVFNKSLSAEEVASLYNSQK